MPTLATATTPYYGGGQVNNPADVISVTGQPSSNSSKIVGSLAVDNTAGTMYGLVSRSGGSALWKVLTGSNPNSITGTSQAMVAGNLYVPTSASQTTFTLPATANVGDTFTIAGGIANTAGWVIAQNSGQTIHKENTASTTGASGTATSAAHQCESIQLVCVKANTDFVIMYSNGTVTLA